MRLYGDILFAFLGVFYDKIKQKRRGNMEYTKEFLAEINIHYLRRLGKSIGVKSPTSLTKTKLIEQIIGVSKGEIAPCFSKKGRPSQKLNLSHNKNQLKLQGLCYKLTKVEELIIEIKNDLQKVLDDN